jgi:hypothetical protein
LVRIEEQGDTRCLASAFIIHAGAELDRQSLAFPEIRAICQAEKGVLFISILQPFFE